jgi:hypothetical protein
MAEIDRRLAGINHFRASAGDGPGPRRPQRSVQRNLQGIDASLCAIGHHGRKTAKGNEDDAATMFAV